MGVYSDRLKRGVLGTGQARKGGGGVLGTGHVKKGGLTHGSGSKKGGGVLGTGQVKKGGGGLYCGTCLILMLGKHAEGIESMYLVELLMSLTYIKNNRCPNIDPCGTPHLIYLVECHGL